MERSGRTCPLRLRATLRLDRAAARREIPRACVCITSLINIVAAARIHNCRASITTTPAMATTTATATTATATAAPTSSSGAQFDGAKVRAASSAAEVARSELGRERRAPMNMQRPQGMRRRAGGGGGGSQALPMATCSGALPVGSRSKH